MTGTVKEVSIADLKAKNNPMFDLCIKDYAQYPAMVVFCITQGRGDIFDYDFEKISRENKLQRIYFAYNGEAIRRKGLKINPETCISCGQCQSKCSFLAIKQRGTAYAIDPNRCDECGDCYLVCPVQAVTYGGET